MQGRGDAAFFLRPSDALYDTKKTKPAEHEGPKHGPGSTRQGTATTP